MGWALAYYQWYTGRSFKTIRRYLPMSRLIQMYPALHEVSEQRFVDTVEVIAARELPDTRLRMHRRAMQYSQRLLAAESGVSLRMIQQYEQRAKDINRASADSLLALSRTLGCEMTDIMEAYRYPVKSSYEGL